MELKKISFCNKTCYNICSNSFKEKLLKQISDKYNFQFERDMSISSVQFLSISQTSKSVIALPKYAKAHLSRYQSQSHSISSKNQSHE